MDTLDRFSSGIRYILSRRTEAELLLKTLVHNADNQRDGSVLMHLDYASVVQAPKRAVPAAQSPNSKTYQVRDKNDNTIEEFDDFIDVVAFILKTWW